MTDKEIYQQIEECREEADALYERIHEQVEESIVKHAQTKKKRKKLFAGILSVAVVLVVTLGIVLPITLQPQSQPQDEVIRYSDADVLLPDELNCNLKEYYADTNQTLLYLDWYEDAEDVLTFRYYEDGKKSETVYLHETVIDGNSGRIVELSLMKQNIVVESLDELFEEFQATNINNIQVVYALNKSMALAKFEYQGYKYYLKIDDEITFDFLVETIESMFNN